MSSRARAALRRAIFGIGALPYDLVSSPAAWAEHCRKMISPVPREGPLRWLDVGCGPGVSTVAMAQEDRDLAVGVDLSAPMLARARARLRRERLQNRAFLVRGDAARLPFADRSFDAACGHSLLYLLPDRAAALAELSRVLRPGGFLALLEPAAGPGGRGLLGIARRTPSLAVAMGLWRLASSAAGRFLAADLAATIGRAGFTGIRVEPTLEGLGLLAHARRPGSPAGFPAAPLVR